MAIEAALPIIAQAGLGIASLLESGANNRASKGFLGDYKKADAAIPLYDPNMLALEGETERRRRSFEAGADPLTAFNIRQVNQTGAQTQENAIRAGARGVGDLMRVQANTNEGIAGASALAGRRADNAFAMEGNLTSAAAKRVYDRKMSDTQLMWNQYARAREDANRQRSAGIGMLLGIGASAGGPVGGPKVAGTPSVPAIPDTTGTMGTNYFDSLGYGSSNNYGFNYQPPSPNYGFGY